MDEVEREEIQVLFLRAADFPHTIGAAWEDLESRLRSLRGRKFYGAFYPRTTEYHACVEVEPGDDPDVLGLEVGTLPRGRYARVRLHGEPPGIYEHIAPTFEQLAERPDRDDSRPSIEFYRRRDQIDVLLPIA